MDEFLASNEATEGTSFKSLEYEAQLFNQTPGSVSDEVYNIIYDYTHDGIRLTYEYLTNKFKDVDRKILKKNSEALKSELMASAETLCDKLELNLAQSIMKIPDSAILPEDACHMDKNLVSTNESLLNKELKHLRSEIDKEIDSYHFLCSEQKKLQRLLSAHQQAWNICSKFEESSSNLKLDELPEIIKESTKNVKDVMNDFELLNTLNSTEENK